MKEQDICFSTRLHSFACFTSISAFSNPKPKDLENFLLAPLVIQLASFELRGDGKDERTIKYWTSLHVRLEFACRHNASIPPAMETLAEVPPKSFLHVPPTLVVTISLEG